MKSLFKRQQQSVKKEIITFYLIGDQAANKQSFYQYLQLEPEPDALEVSISIKPLAQNSHLEIYDFPTDKIVRQALNIYLKILPRPTNILYFLKQDSTHKEIWEWIKLLRQSYLDERIIFVSQAQTYQQREKVITKVGRQFQYPVIQNICFVILEPSSFQKIFEKIEPKGVKISTAVCLMPTLREKISQSLNNIVCRLKKILRIFYGKGEENSVI